jgi:hypothetical protein
MVALALAAAIALGPASHAGSAYLSLAADRTVDAPVTLLQETLLLRQPDTVFVETDGTYAPLTPSSAARVVVEVDGLPATNGSTLDWRGSLGPQEHSFNAVGAVRLPAGKHLLALVAAPVDRFAGPFLVRAASNLSVLVHPAARVAVATLRRKTGRETLRPAEVEPQR